MKELMNINGYDKKSFSFALGAFFLKISGLDYPVR
jgi:hypothetical protein